MSVDWGYRAKSGEQEKMTIRVLDVIVSPNNVRDSLEMSSHTFARWKTGELSLRTITKSRILSSGLASLPFTKSSKAI